ncbi:hypothetical protein V6B33_01955 [Mangrovibacillus sp. Mu-81]|jgi:hypothetical protein|uniref:hypothetical protein n=1 Tax=Mangrovibacillus sp. Mu-81 TaxID=3121478 RepID=UPI002FE43A82
MIFLAFGNIFLGILAIVAISTGWGRFENWVYRRFSASLNQLTLLLLMSLILFFLFLVMTILIGYLNHFRLINSLIVSSFILLCVNLFSPYYSSHIVNEERVFMKYAVKIPEDTNVTLFNFKMSPFFIASLGIVMVTMLLTIRMI